MKLLKTTINKKGGGHYHIVYIRKDGAGLTSLDNRHQHEIVFQPGAEEIVNPETGVVIQESSQGEWIVGPSEDGHSHELTEMLLKTAKKKLTDIEKVQTVKQLYSYAMENEEDSRKNGKESEGFYDGTKQWEKKVKDKLESSQRAALTINEIEPKVDLLSGYQRQNRTDIRYFPVENGDARVADILNVVVKVILEQNNYAHEETKVFEDEVIPGRGFFNVYITHDKNIRGDIVVEKFGWENACLGPHEKENLDDLEYLVKKKWFSKGKIKQLWPDKAEKIQKSLDAYLMKGKDPHVQTPGKQYSSSENTTDVQMDSTPDPDYIDIKKKEFNLLECWKKEYKRVFILVNESDDFVFNAEGWSDKDVNKVRTIAGFSKIPRNIYKIRKIVIAGDVLLDDEFPVKNFLEDEFSLIPVYAKKRENNFWGKVEGAKGMQREINKRHSQTVDIMNKVANYGYYVDAQTFRTPADLESFKDNVSSPGAVHTVANLNRRPEKEEGVKFPSEIVNLEAMSTEKLREIMNINPELLGMSSKAESGIAIIEKKRQGLIGNEFLFDNLSQAKKKLGMILVKLIQKVYTPERILRILENRSKSRKETVEIGGQPFSEINPEDIITLLNEADLTKYDVAVGESVYNPTTKHANFVIWAEMSGKGIPVPPSLLVDLSDLPEKDKVKAEIEKIQQQQAEVEKRKTDTEIQKSMIAAQKGSPGQ